MTRTALLLRTDGTTERFDLDVAASPLEILTRKLGCNYVDAIALSPLLHLWVDDEGLLKPDRTVNPVLGALVVAETQSILGQQLYGHAVFTGGADDEGNTTGLTDRQAAHLEDSIEKVVGVFETEGWPT